MLTKTADYILSSEENHKYYILMYCGTEQNGHKLKQNDCFIYRCNDMTAAEMKTNSIENKLHWGLDMVFYKYESIVGKGNPAESFNVLRRIALNILKG